MILNFIEKKNFNVIERFGFEFHWQKLIMNAIERYDFKLYKNDI